MNKNTATVIVALITALGGLATSMVSLRASSEKSDLAVVKASYETLAGQVNRLSEELEKIHDHVYRINPAAGGEEEEDLPRCPPYDLGPEAQGADPLDAGLPVTPAPPAPVVPPPAPVPPKGDTAPLQLQRVPPTFEQMMQQKGF